MIDEPSIGDEKAARLYQRDQIAALFRSRPLEEIDNAELKKITPHYQQRISECRRELNMNIRVVKRWTKSADGRMKRLDGDYIFKPYTELGRDAGTFTEREWTTEGPFTEPFSLKP